MNNYANPAINPSTPDDIEHDRQCFTCTADVKRWAKAVTRDGKAFRYNPLTWPADLWGRKASEIIDFIEDRFWETKEEKEYYPCMLYLSTRLDAETLYVPWKESKNYTAICQEQSEQNGEGNRDIAPSKKAVNGIGKVGAKSPQSNVKVMKSGKRWRTM